MVLHGIRNITAPFADHLKFHKKKMTFTQSLWVNSCKSKEKQLELEHYTF